MDARCDIESALDAFGVDATVTVPDGVPVATVVFWLPPVTVEVPAGEQFRRVEARRVIVVSKADVPQLPRGTVIVAPEVDGGDDRTWVIDEVQRVYEDHYRATVIESQE